MSGMKMNRQRSLKRSFNHSLIRKRILKLSMGQVRSLVQDDQAEEVEYLDEYNTDMENYDSDDSWTKDEIVDDQIFHDVSSKTERSNVSPFLEIKDNYIITVFRDNSGMYRCQYEPPRWMTTRVNPDYKQIISSIVKCISMIATYFEKSQQGFLTDQDISNFTFSKKLTQKNFVKKLNKNNEVFDEVDFSLIKDKIWFVWDTHCFQLESLFKNGSQ